MRRDDFDYELPRELIAQFPPAERGASRLLHLDGVTASCTRTGCSATCPDSWHAAMWSC